MQIKLILVSYLVVMLNKMKEKEKKKNSIFVCLREISINALFIVVELREGVDTIVRLKHL